jgi:hypothetical protein
MLRLTGRPIGFFVSFAIRRNPTTFGSPRSAGIAGPLACAARRDKSASRARRAARTGASATQTATRSGRPAWDLPEFRENTVAELKSGAVDDVRVGVKWPDGPAEITTGKRLREKII